MNADKSIRFDRNALVTALQGAGAVVTGQSVKCPFHEDGNPSGWISQGKKDNVWRYQCHDVKCGVSGDIFDIQAKISGKPLGNVLGDAGSRLKTKTPPPPSQYTPKQKK